MRLLLAITGEMLKVIYHPLYCMNNHVLIWGDWHKCWGTSVSLYGVIDYHVTLSEGHMIANHPIYGVIGYHVTFSEGHMIDNHPI